MFPRIFGTSAQLTKSLLLTAAGGVTTYLSHETIQKLRQLDPSPLKNTLKDNVSLTSSTVNAFLLSVSGVELIGQLISSGVWNKLSTPQQLAITTGGILYLGGAIYSMSVFGSEHNTAAAGVSAALGVLAGEATTNFVSFLANRASWANQESRRVDSQNQPLEEIAAPEDTESLLQPSTARVSNRV